jgi:hypothetical protein
MAWINLWRLGRQCKDRDTAFYIIAFSDRINQIRKELTLPPKHLHVTLGFDENDLHGVDKGRGTAI